MAEILAASCATLGVPMLKRQIRVSVLFTHEPVTHDFGSPSCGDLRETRYANMST